MILRKSLLDNKILNNNGNIISEVYHKTLKVPYIGSSQTIQAKTVLDDLTDQREYQVTSYRI